MTTQQIGFSILSAPLAAIDRRALSQAWYSALHLTQEQPTTRVQATIRAQTQPRILATQRATTSVARRRLPLANAPSSARSTPPRVESLGERRVPRSLLARRIERELLCPGRAGSRATFSVAGSKARVHVTIQRERRGLQLVAVCSPRVRAVVARALEQARYALARRSIALGVRVKES